MRWEGCKLEAPMQSGAGSPERVSRMRTSRRRPKRGMLCAYLPFYPLATEGTETSFVVE